MPRADLFRLLILGGLLSIFALFVNQPVLDHDWLYFDDDINITLNPHLTGGSWDGVKWAWTDLGYTRRFMPLGWLLFDGLFRLAGLNATAFHAASWLLAAVNTVLLFAVVRRLLAQLAGSGASPKITDTGAALASALTVVHPLWAEAIGWASGLLYLFATTLALTACLVALREPTNRLSPTLRFTASMLFLGSLLVYPVFLTLPLVLMVAALAASERPRGALEAIRAYWPWLGASVIVGGINFYAAATASGGHVALAGITGYPLMTRFGNIAHGVLNYLARLFWPGPTSVYYGPDGPPWPPVWFLVLLCAGVAALAVWSRTRRFIGTSLAGFSLCLLPFVRAFDQGQTAGDRYAIPLLLSAAVCVAYALVALVSARGRLLLGLGVIAMTLVAFPPYRAALAVWRNTPSVQQRLDEIMGNRPHIKLGITRPAVIAFLSGQYDRSREKLAQGHRLYGENPDLVETENFISGVRARLNTPPGGDPTIIPYAVMHRDLARALAAQGHDYAAKVHLRFAEGLLQAKVD